MEKEIEAKFLAVDHVRLRKKIESLGGRRISERTLMKRYIYKFDPDPSSAGDYFWFRVRSEGTNNTLTYKRVSGDTIHDVEEISIEVDDIDKTAMILEKANLARKATQLNFREEWKIGEVDLMLDEWPHVPPFIEIEAPSEEKVKDMASKLGFDWVNAVFGSADSVYEAHFDIENGFEVTGLPMLTFEDPLPKEIEQKRK